MQGIRSFVARRGVPQTKSPGWGNRHENTKVRKHETNARMAGRVKATWSPVIERRCGWNAIQD
jgi:hypothetical protein